MGRQLAKTVTPLVEPDLPAGFSSSYSTSGSSGTQWPDMTLRTVPRFVTLSYCVYALFRPLFFTSSLQCLGSLKQISLELSIVGRKSRFESPFPFPVLNSRRTADRGVIFVREDRSRCGFVFCRRFFVCVIRHK